MSSQASWHKALGIALLLILAACATAQSPTGAVAGGPREVVVNSTPGKGVIIAPEPPQAPSPEPPAQIPEPPAVIVDPAPEVIIIPEDKPIADVHLSCIQGCQMQCDADAKQACSQGTGAGCKSSCGRIIDPSACSVACSFRTAGSCEPKFVSYCVSQCESKCR